MEVARGGVAAIDVPEVGKSKGGETRREPRRRSMLSCAAARAFAASLLETPHFGGSDGQAPSTLDVVMDCRHLGPDCR